ncbi:lysozyme inhibitor LprI family protein [Pontivivens ytuae]|uniref:DUF1311 domain-containing protein n=1 Tax=Pontivivens ytuae TaxID=2789856 RepID=A0A7S9QET2_9RHOB|nr:lysozyme inhibitor LprI family protein [Pontivivens ytuae]QPH55536.1 DUF1311 domain-containing protein [Pontivivens ytuae]
MSLVARFGLLAAVLCAPAMAANERYPEGQAQEILDTCLTAEGRAEREHCMGRIATACMDADPGQNQTTVGMMDCYLLESRIWDTRLNAEYAAVIDVFAEMDTYDAEFNVPLTRVDTLRDAQRAWIAFRDAECSNRYALWGSGSMRLIEGAICRSELTALRTLDLIDKREWPN